jgi:hypothetical protein
MCERKIQQVRYPFVSAVIFIGGDREKNCTFLAFVGHNNVCHLSLILGDNIFALLLS